MLNYIVVTAKSVTSINEQIGIHVIHGYQPNGPLICLPGSYAQPMLLKDINKV